MDSLVFDLWSRVYDVRAVQRVAYRPVHDAVVEALLAEPPQRIVDVGCGTGLLTRRLHDTLRATIVGLDYSPGMLARAAARAPALRWVRGDAMRLPLASGSADALCCTESFHWYPDQAAAAAEFHRVLAPGGRAFVAHVSPPMAARLGTQVRWPSPQVVERLLSGAGLEVVEQRRVWRPPGGPLLSALLTVGRKP
ncbi:MAG: methyltransferase domain-containing protein [Acidimicrobiales bacterium]